MWPKVIAQLFELLPHVSRLVPGAGKVFLFQGAAGKTEWGGAGSHGRGVWGGPGAGAGRGGGGEERPRGGVAGGTGDKRADCRGSRRGEAGPACGGAA